ncbi:molybdate ABC transporter substrate-binding protein, partial [Acinetobacter baumannii]
MVTTESSCFSTESLYTTNFTEPLSYQGSAFLKL